MTIRDKVTTEGGNRGYRTVRSKIAKDKNGEGKRVTMARERLMQKLGYDPGYNKVAAHKSGGSHFEKNGGAAELKSRSENTAESNKARKKKLSEKLKEMK